ncbi:MAG: pentapeptide repeat-containing protein [Bradyrhizobium sp.]|nr:pentapeptide repeat-containing protein [Bradyrhizobium sp.]
MANDEHVRLLKQGVAAWNAWRDRNPDIRLDLRNADLCNADLNEADLRGADLREADLGLAELSDADLRDADLRGTNLSGANLSGRLPAPRGADLRGADLREAQLGVAFLSGANLGDADLRGADLQAANLVATNLTGADLTGCRIYGVSVWNLILDSRTKQQNLIITSPNETAITVDNIEVAQFIHLILHNQKIRDVIDTITSKVVLILGRFTDERKAVLDALREELRKRNYLPILFDFELPERRNVTETVTLLARMARFIIADLTDPSSIPQELQAIIPSVRVPVQPLLLEGSSLYSMFKDFDPQDFHWVLPVYRYKEPKQLLATLAENVIAPAEGKVKALEERRRILDAELTKPP